MFVCGIDKTSFKHSFTFYSIQKISVLKMVLIAKNIEGHKFLRYVVYCILRRYCCTCHHHLIWDKVSYWSIKRFYGVKLSRRKIIKNTPFLIISLQNQKNLYSKLVLRLCIVFFISVWVNCDLRSFSYTSSFSSSKIMHVSL